MNKVVNKRLNTLELILVLVACTCIIISAVLNINNISLNFIKVIISNIGIISEILVITIELMLFIFLKKNYKYLYLGYIALDIVLLVLLTKIIPFGGLITIIALSIAKYLYRDNYFKEIYEAKVFKRYCKMFNIKMPKVSRSRTIKNTRRKQVRPKSTSTARKQQKSYA